jgi:hypothetical protein
MFPYCELLVDEGSKDVGMPSWSILHEVLHLIWDIDCEEKALGTRRKETLAVDFTEDRSTVLGRAITNLGRTAWFYGNNAM